VDYDKELATPDSAWKLLNKYSIEACSQAQGFAPKLKQKYTTSARFKEMAHTLLESKDKVACIHLEKMRSGQIRTGGTGTGGTLCLTASLLDDQPTWVPAYFLPWDDKGGAVEITIPKKSGAADKQHPGLFFTTCLSGCSVVFKGSAQEPTIYHCGINGNLPSGEDANTFWKEFVEYIDQEAKGPGARHGAVQAQATKSQYVSGIKDPTRPSYGTVVPKTTQHALDMQKTVKDHYATAYPSSPIDILDVMPWGAVFGLRRGDDWKFYLQENVNIVYVRRVMDPSGTREIKQMMNVARPMVVSEVFPGGSGVAGTKHNWRSLVLARAGDTSVAPPQRQGADLPSVQL